MLSHSYNLDMLLGQKKEHIQCFKFIRNVIQIPYFSALIYISLQLIQHVIRLAGTFFRLH